MSCPSRTTIPSRSIARAVLPFCCGQPCTQQHGSSTPTAPCVFHCLSTVFVLCLSLHFHWPSTAFPLPFIGIPQPFPSLFHCLATVFVLCIPQHDDDCILPPQTRMIEWMKLQSGCGARNSPWGKEQPALSHQRPSSSRYGCRIRRQLFLSLALVCFLLALALALARAHDGPVLVQSGVILCRLASTLKPPGEIRINLVSPTRVNDTKQATDTVRPHQHAPECTRASHGGHALGIVMPWPCCHE